MVSDKTAAATTRRWARRFGLALCGMLLLTACTDAGSEEQVSQPVVGEREFDQRLTEHLSRFVSEVLDSDAHASEPKVSRSVGCEDLPANGPENVSDRGPDWGVVPRAKITVSAGKNAMKYLDDLQYWMLDIFDDVEEGWSTTRKNVHTVTGAYKDGTQVLMELPGGGSNLTITVTGPCTWPSDRPGGPSSGRLAPLPPPPGPDTGLGDDACRSPKIKVYDIQARPFAGRGPHLMALVDYSDEESVEYTEFFLPDGWEPKVDVVHPDDSDRKKVQLLVCVRMDAGRDTGRNVTCYYSTSPMIDGSPHTFDVLEGTYHVVVREARTGKKVKEFTVPGTQGDEDSCPYETGYERKIARGIDEKELHRELRPLLTSPR